MRYQKMWMGVMRVLCTLLLGLALPAGAQQGSESPGDVSALSLEKGVIGKSVRTTNGENVGEIEDVVFSRQGRIAHYIVDAQGLPGIGEKTVALNPDQIQFMGEDYVQFNGTRDDLAGMPEVNSNAFGLYHGYYGFSQGAYGYGPPGGTYGPSYGRRAYNPPQSYDRSYMGGAYGQGPMGQYQEMQEPRQGEGYWENRQPYRQQYPGRDYYDQRQGRMGQDPGARLGKMAGPIYRGISGDGFLNALVLDSQNRNVGEVQDLVVDPQNGRITHAVVGLGDKQVLVPFNQLRNLGPNAVMYRGDQGQLAQMQEYLVDEDGRVTSAGISQTEERAGASPQGGSGGQQHGGQPQTQKN